MGSLGTSIPYGRRLLHTTVDELAEIDPLRPWASIPYDDKDLSKGYEDITYRMLANAVNKLAWLIESSLGPATNFKTVAYIGQPDIRYQIMSLATAKAQYKVLFSSHVHSAAAHLALMEQTETQALFVTEGILVADILSVRPMPLFVIPDLDDLLSATAVKHYPYTKSFEEAAQDPWLILHTSGTTGKPKPIMYNHAAVAALDAHALLPLVDPISGQRRRVVLGHPGPTRLFVPFRHFHGICTVVLANTCIFGGAVYIPGMRRRLTNSGDVFNILDYARVDNAFLSPAIIEDIIAVPNGAKYLSKIKTLLYGGAPIQHAVAQVASQYTDLQSQWGITESGKGIDYITSPDDYDYCTFDTVSAGMRMQPVEGTNGLLRMFIDRTPASYPYMPLFHRQPEVTSWDTGDLWQAHPEPAKAPFTFRFCGRADDLITYTEGSNFQPTHYELLHAEHPLIRTAVLAGSGHRQPVLLLELHDPSLLTSSTTSPTTSTPTPPPIPTLQATLYKESIVPTNALAPRNGQVSPKHVIFATADKAFERNVKGTVARKATIAKFEGEIADVYRMYGDREVDLNKVARIVSGAD